MLVQYWHAESEIPDDVRQCLRTWDLLDTAGFERILFHDDSARDFLRENLDQAHVDAFDRCPHPAMRCDLFRLSYLVVKGGFYVDADDVYAGTGVDHLFADGRLKVQPLCYDPSAQTMVQWTEATRTLRAPDDWIYYVNNNPLIAAPGHPVLTLALERATQQVLAASTSQMRDVQSLTGPGNLSASLVAHSLSSDRSASRDVVFLYEWEVTSMTEWDLAYRQDVRNWRRWMRLAPTDPSPRVSLVN